MPQTTLTPAIALAHERLYPRVAALLRQVERSVGRKPGQPVPAATLAVSRPLFAEARTVLGRQAGRLAGAASADLGALAVALGQLQAALEAFEGQNSGWSAELRCTAWHVAGAALPVSRHQSKLPPKANALPPPHPDDDDAAAMRAKLMRRLLTRENARYMQGYRDAEAGRPPMPPITAIGPVPGA